MSVNVSKTIIKCLIVFCFFFNSGCYRPVNKPDLSANQINDRLKFVEAMLERNDLDKFIFTDEKLFKCDLRGDLFHSIFFSRLFLIFFYFSITE